MRNLIDLGMRVYPPLQFDKDYVGGFFGRLSFLPKPEGRAMHIYDIKITTLNGYVGRRISAPSAAHVIAHLAEEDAEFTADETVTKIEISRVQL